ncbi:ATP-binding cassette, subfamily C [Acrasis kona]|uniref:ATP-binding cassette, subfamily C n=1 Tax=Acrasis kona TaxID=1008807 RepID=A0AAW2ZSQ3_9EUKA
MACIRGSVELSARSMCYCPQQPWIQNATIRDNICFGKPFNKSKYLRTIKCCALERDLEILPNGDETEIGEKGTNLSGGQRHRISLARAVYSDAEIYLLDDVLSAVDAHVGKHIFDQCINGELKGKTIILVTHQWHFLKDCDQVLVFENGSLTEDGTYDQLMQNQKFGQIVQQFILENQGQIENQQSNPDDGDSNHLEESNPDVQTKVEQPMAPSGSTQAVASSAPTKKASGKLMQDEERSTGSVDWRVYKSYFNSAGGAFIALFILSLFALSSAATVLSGWWLSYWAEDSRTPNQSRSLIFYIGIYIGIGLGAVSLQFVRELVLAFTGIQSCTTLHKKALDRVMRAPCSFFDTTPVGRIINRFSKDMETIDSQLIMNLKSFLGSFMSVLASLCLIAAVTPLFLIVLVPITLLYYFVQQYYRYTSRELKRLASITRSPLFAHFGETLSGVSTIRAYQSEKRFCELNQKYIDEANESVYFQFAAQRWLAVRIECISRFVVFSAAMLAVLYRDSLHPSLAGLSLTFALQITGSISYAVRNFTDTESNMNSVERIVYYCDEIEQEAEPIIEGKRPPENWPDKGQIEFDHLWLKYRPTLDPALKDFTANVLPAEKVGIAGRTGAGKSTLVMALFRLVEYYKGTVRIDGIDISSIGLHDLRSKLSIIPQDPFMFSGTIRFNIDPNQEYSDAEIWQALERSHMKSYVSQLPLGLSDIVTENGDNLSVGQRQLFCLARAILRKTKVLVLDEATASVDIETDALIQHTIRKEFSERTMLTIAHRLNTIVDSDKVAVLDYGELKEFDSPKELLTQPQGLFNMLVNQTGKSNSEYLRRIANGEISYLQELQNNHLKHSVE